MPVAGCAVAYIISHMIRPTNPLQIGPIRSKLDTLQVCPAIVGGSAKETHGRRDEVCLVGGGGGSGHNTHGLYRQLSDPCLQF